MVYLANDALLVEDKLELVLVVDFFLVYDFGHHVKLGVYVQGQEQVSILELIEAIREPDLVQFET